MPNVNLAAMRDTLLPRLLDNVQRFSRQQYYLEMSRAVDIVWRRGFPQTDPEGDVVTYRRFGYNTVDWRGVFGTYEASASRTTNQTAPPRGDDYWLVTGEDDGLEELARSRSLAAK